MAGDELNGENPNNKDSNFVLSDMVKKKILSMYNISKDETQEHSEEITNKATQDEKSQNNN